MRYALVRVAVGLLLSSTNAQAQGDGTGLKVSAAVDTVGLFRADDDSAASDRFDVREAEILLTAPVDHVFDGLLSAAAHRESGVSLFEVHEAFISSSKLIPRSRIRLGQFFLGLGRLNQIHRHEWPFILPPKVQADFFGSEGALDAGFEYSWLAPTPFVLEARAGVTNGWTYGHTHNEGEKPRQPTHYGRLSTFLAMPGKGGAQLAGNYLSRMTADGDKMSLVGADFAAKWRDAGVLSWLLMGEVWQRTKQPHAGAEERNLGFYVYPQYALTAELSLGVLIDYFTVPTLRDVSGAEVANARQGLTPTVTYKPSEFSTLRLAFERTVDHQDGNDDRTNQLVACQATFLIGAHPAHDF